MRAAVLILLVGLCYGCTSPPFESSYGEVVRFAKGMDITYPDFIVRYKGERRELVESYGREFVYYDFELSSENEVSTVSWTAGTGAIAPLFFSFGGKEYCLVLKINELKPDNYMLENDEMIIWPKDIYLTKLAESR